ncbi:MAG: hypothetical protein JXQ67_05100 [Campylobacterales bacterium]|nr:hypothetical protein [Campylobacterales bacterium]
MTDKISGDLQNYVRSGLKLYICEDTNFNLYIFSMHLDEETMKNHWENIQNKIALNFQSNLDKEIELWNIYIVFFLENEIVKQDLKYKIENDHYCARKIVIDKVGNIKNNEAKIKAEINKKLFDLEIPSSKTPDSIEELEKEIKELDPRLIDLEQINRCIDKYKD